MKIHYNTFIDNKNHHIQLTPFKSPPIKVKELRSNKCDKNNVAVAHDLFLHGTEIAVCIVVGQSRAILVCDCHIINLTYRPI